jgi:hypothetical protein
MTITTAMLATKKTPMCSTLQGRRPGIHELKPMKLPTSHRKGSSLDKVWANTRTCNPQAMLQPK